METYFLNLEHKERFKEMIEQDKTHSKDTERLSLFYIISGNEELYRKRRYIYDTYDHRIFSNFENNGIDFSYGLKSLIKLGYNLYNGWSDSDTTPLRLLGSLDSNNIELARHAIAIRFNYNGLNRFYADLTA